MPSMSSVSTESAVCSERLLTGVFANPALGGVGVYDYVANKVADYSTSAQVISQLWAIGTTLVWSGVVSIIAYKLVDLVIGLRVTEDEEREGLDTSATVNQLINIKRLAAYHVGRIRPFSTFCLQVENTTSLLARHFPGKKIIQGSTSY